ncbi:hypothetical protein K432DRAFT_327052 [Lepidopterella palustris CBS 459.81]|uniref:Nephrocystin 3-like N-terminal domain-containing protein n=1 Tax=Lepidopterella palustris CBS 459.81 TaxID=1314670 RepID=A0A8E2JFT7_9PEZI|nr:hypothetical protein K432DRAFT_327052 [Lepidopterella palustris CBS 459.81]
MDDSEKIRDFIDEKGPRIDNAFAEPSHFDKQKAIYIPKMPYHDLEDALKRYNETAKLTKAHGYPFDVEKCTWSDVLEEANKAQEKYFAAGAKNFARKIFRTAGDYSDVINPWIDLIPGDYGATVLTGGLKVIFMAAGQMAENREKILQAFVDIPDILGSTQEKREIFRSDKRLRECAIDLYTTLLSAIGELIDSLLEPSYKKFSKAFWKGSRAGKSIDEVLSRVQSSANIFHNRVDNIRDEKIEDTHKKVTSTEKQATVIRDVVTGTKIAVKENKVEVVKVGNAVKDVGNQVESSKVAMTRAVRGVGNQVEEVNQTSKKIEGGVRDAGNKLTNLEGAVNGGFQGVSGKIDEIQEMQKLMLASMEADGLNAKTGLYHFLTDRIKDLESINKRLRKKLKGERGQAMSSASFITVDHLLEVLDETHMGVLPHMKAIKDLDHMLRQGQNFDNASQSQAGSLLHTYQFTDWFSSEYSEILLVDGNTNSIGTGRTSPMSFLCATLVMSLVKKPSAISLHFFCGQHMASNDPLLGPNGLVRSLIMQLIMSGKPLLLNFVNSTEYYHALKNQDLDALCHTFQQLVKQVPPETTVYCIVDGISLYEREDMRKDLWFLVEKLKQIIQDDRLQFSFKLLMTNPQASRYTTNQVDPHQYPHQYVSLRSGANGRFISERGMRDVFGSVR